MIDFTGHTIGNYQILEMIGQGGMAVVYKAIDTRLENEVALKFINKDEFPASAQSVMLKRFEREARLMASLNHPNIVKVTDYGEYEGYPYLVMPFLPGGTLKERMGKPIPWRDVIKVILPIAKALSYAHAQKDEPVHRDVKPSNILMTENGDPVLTDFGIAQIREPEHGVSLTSTRMGIGTSVYMSHEQLTGKKVDHRTDVYGLGVVMFEMLTGRLPYPGETNVEVALRQAKDPLPRPSLYDSKIPLYVDKVVMKAMSKEAKDCYQSMDELVVALQSLLDNSGPKNPHGWIKFGFAGIIVLGLGIWALTQVNPPDPGPMPTPTPTKLLPSPSPVKTMTVTPVILSATPTLTPTPTQPEPYIYDLPGNGKVRLTNKSLDYYMPALSPDQTRMVAFRESGSAWQLVEIDVNGGGEVRQITSDNYNYWHPHFSKDGENILVAANITGSYHIYLISYETGEVVEQLTAGNSRNMTPYWMPDFKKFVFMSNRDGNYEIYLGFMDGSPPERLTFNDSWDGTCSVSPDGALIAFYSERSGNPEIYIMDINTGETVQLTSDNARDAEPVFSPDGQWIAFESDRDGDYDIWAIRPDGSDLQKVIDSPTNDQIPVFSPDGKWLLYQSNVDGKYQLFRNEWQK